MFLGTYEPSLLEKRRIALPKKIRSEVAGKRVILTIGFEICIFGFDEKMWQEAVRPELEKPFFSDIGSRNMRRKMCMNATVVEIDIQGRVVVPDMMMEYARIQENIMLIGAGDHFELWSKQEWNQYSSQILKVTT